MSLPVIDVYGSLDCPYAYLATYRLRHIWPAYAGQMQLRWRALSLEYVNARATSQPLFHAERELFASIEPDLPFTAWSRPAWDWPTTLWPAFEALACAQAQHQDAAMRMSWALRFAFFAESRNLSLRHEVLSVAQAVAQETPLDMVRFERDWDAGRYKATVIEDCRRGWHELKVNGSATFVLPDGRQVTNPALGEVDFDEEHLELRSYTPYDGDPCAVYRDLLESAVGVGQ